MKLHALAILILAISVGCATTAAEHQLPAIANATAPAPGIVSAGRLDEAGVERVREAGFRHVIDLTPDAETPGFDEAAVVRASGLAYSNLPLRGPVDLTHDNVVAFDALLRNAQRPVLVHCASGNRVGAMAALRAAWVEGKDTEAAIAVGKAWGLKGLEGEVRQRIQAGGSAASPPAREP